jgi:hypothetical protein
MEFSLRRDDSSVTAKLAGKGNRGSGQLPKRIRGNAPVTPDFFVQEPSVKKRVKNAPSVKHLHAAFGSMDNGKGHAEFRRSC